MFLMTARSNQYSGYAMSYCCRPRSIFYHSYMLFMSAGHMVGRSDTAAAASTKQMWTPKELAIAKQPLQESTVLVSNAVAACLSTTSLTLCQL